MSTEELQDEIKKLCKQMGWSLQRAARCIYCELNDSDDEDGIRHFTEVFKKHLSRATTAPEKLQNYLDILSRQRDAKKIGVIKPTYISTGNLPPDLEKELRTISRNIDRKLK